MLQREIRALSLKSKSFIDARRDMDSFDYNIRQLSGECRTFEDSLYSNVIESIATSTRATTPDEMFSDILKMVCKFLQEKKVEGGDKEEVAMSIAKYLCNAASSFQSADENEDALTEMLNDFKSFLPANAEVTQEEMVTFIANVIGNIQDAGEENQTEVLKEIINTTIEAANQTAISSNSYLQHIITEIFKSIIVTVRIPQDISEEDCATEILDRLSRISSIGARYVNVEDAVADIIAFGIENLEEEISSDLLKRIILNIVSKL